MALHNAYGLSKWMCYQTCYQARKSQPCWFSKFVMHMVCPNERDIKQVIKQESFNLVDFQNL